MALQLTHKLLQVETVPHTEFLLNWQTRPTCMQQTDEMIWMRITNAAKWHRTLQITWTQEIETALDTPHVHDRNTKNLNTLRTSILSTLKTVGRSCPGRSTLTSWDKKCTDKIVTNYERLQCGGNACMHVFAKAHLHSQGSTWICTRQPKLGNGSWIDTKCEGQETLRLSWRTTPALNESSTEGLAATYALRSAVSVHWRSSQNSLLHCNCMHAYKESGGLCVLHKAHLYVIPHIELFNEWLGVLSQVHHVTNQTELPTFFLG